MFRGRSKTLTTPQAPSQIRIEKDLKDLGSDRLETDYSILTIKSSYVESKILTMRIELFCKKGLYANAKYNFLIFMKKYPYLPPRIFCTSAIYHPNINIDTGEVCLPILDINNWTPVLTLRSILISLDMILIEPNLDYIANHPIAVDCANLFSENDENFKERVKFTLLGGYFFGNYRFPPNQHLMSDLSPNSRKRGRNVVESTVEYFEATADSATRQENKRFFPGADSNESEERVNLETELEDLASRFTQLNKRDLLTRAGKMMHSATRGEDDMEGANDGKLVSDEMFHELFAVKCAFQNDLPRSIKVNFGMVNSEENLGMALD